MSNKCLPLIASSTRNFSKTMEPTTTNVDLSHFRKKYGESNFNAFLETHLKSTEPVGQFDDWFKFAQENCKLGYEEINAMALSTATKEGKPSCRMVLLKGYGKDGFRFFTNYNSRKGQQLLENPSASAMFYWPSINRSVQIEGYVAKLPLTAADEYWAKRPVYSQASAFVSEQSRSVATKKVLEDRVKEVEEKYMKQSVPIPRREDWGGYILVPESFEFWHGSENRLHDRIKFRKLKEGETINDEILHQGEDGWYFERLQP